MLLLCVKRLCFVGPVYSGERHSGPLARALLRDSLQREKK